MAKVTLTPYLKSCIVANTSSIVRKSKANPTAYPEPPAGLADELFSTAMPLDYEAKVRELVPDWALPTSEGLSVGLQLSEEGTSYSLSNPVSSPYWYCEYKTPHIVLGGRTTIRNVPGIEEIRWQNAQCVIVPVKDTSLIQLPTVRKHVEDSYAVWKTNNDLELEVVKAVTDMNTFLDQHRTLNRAAEVFGPALWEFVPREYKTEYDRPVEKRAPREKKEPVTVDVSSLVAHATEHRLQLN